MASCPNVQPVLPKRTQSLIDPILLVAGATEVYREETFGRDIGTVTPVPEAHDDGMWLYLAGRKPGLSGDAARRQASRVHLRRPHPRLLHRGRLRHRLPRIPHPAGPQLFGGRSWQLVRCVNPPNWSGTGGG